MKICNVTEYTESKWQTVSKIRSRGKITNFQANRIKVALRVAEILITKVMIDRYKRWQNAKYIDSKYA